MLPLIQVLLTALMLAYAGYWRRRQSKRRAESWDQLVMKLRPNDWGFEDVTERYLYSDRVSAKPEDIWDKISGAKGLWAMYTNAPVLVQLADYAAEQWRRRGRSGGIVGEHPQRCLPNKNVRVDGARPNTSSSRSSIASQISAHRATVAYTAMIARMTTIFQEHSAILFPKFLEAM